MKIQDLNDHQLHALEGLLSDIAELLPDSLKIKSGTITYNLPGIANACREQVVDDLEARRRQRDNDERNQTYVLKDKHGEVVREFSGMVVESIKSEASYLFDIKHWQGDVAFRWSAQLGDDADYKLVVKDQD